MHLDTFVAGGAETVIGVVALLGLAKLFLGGLYTLALVRYRAMIPLMYVLIVADQLGHKALGWMKPIAHVGKPSGFYVNLVLLTLSIVGLVLSLRGRGYLPKPESESA